MKCIKNITIPDKCTLSMIVDWMKEVGANCACAPCEARWQCTHVEKAKIVDAVISKDGDCVALGVETLHYSVNFKDQ